jgi:hypothetical protein
MLTEIDIQALLVDEEIAAQLGGLGTRGRLMIKLHG